ncbi:transposable element Tcb2 transposase [Trichonephila clavipes]|nr:transposable element Tcb2 transposase [Trichonephila clavipes]
MLQPDVVPFLRGIPEAIFQQDNAHPHVAKTVRDICSARHMQILPWPAYSLDMSLTKHVWDLFGWRLDVIRVLQFQKTNFCCSYKQCGIILQAGIKNLFDSMPHCIAALIAARGGYTKY